MARSISTLFSAARSLIALPRISAGPQPYTPNREASIWPFRKAVHAKPRVVIREDASFASKWMKLVSSSGYKGKLKLTGGTINSERVKGTLRLRMTIKSLGRCSTKHRFRVKIQAC